MTVEGKPKRKHKTAAKARAARDRNVARGADPLSTGVYECPECGHWHVGRAQGFGQDRGRTHRSKRRTVGMARTA